MFGSGKVFFVLTLASTAFANVFITTPFASTSYAAGKEAKIEWKDDGNAPTLAQFGPAKISIYAGNSREQTLLQPINASVDVSKVSSLTFIPNASIGPNSNQYFIRVESLSLKDATVPSIPALSFSARFTLTGMNGTFSAVVSSQIAGQSTAPLAGSSSTSSSASKPTSGTITASSTSASASATSANSTKASSASSASATSSQKSSATMIGARAGLIGAFLTALVGVAVF